MDWPSLLPHGASFGLAVLGTVFAVAITTGVLFWISAQSRMRKKKLVVHVIRGHDVKREPSLGGLLSNLDIDPEVAAHPSLAGMRLVSLGDYFASLRPQGDFSYERVVVSVADRFGLSAALPLAMFLPPSWLKDDDVGGLLRSFPSWAVPASRLLQTAISTLDLVAFGQSVQQYAAGQRRKQEAAAAASATAAAAAATAAAAAAASPAAAAVQMKMSAAERAAKAVLQHKGPLDMLLHGGKLPKEGDPPPLPSPLTLSRENVLRMLGLAASDLSDSSHVPGPDPKAFSPLLPDLFNGNGGLLITHSKACAAQCRLMATVLNRLAANALTGLAPAAAELQGCGACFAHFEVEVSEGGPRVDSVEGLLSELRRAGHEVKLRLSSNLTSFGCGLSVKGEDGGWQQVPIAYPLRTGLWARDENGQQMDDVTTIMCHASVLLSVRGPQISFDLEWCLGVTGFTGWLSYASLNREWASGEAFKVTHPMGEDLESEEAQRRLARLLTAATCVLNLAGHKDRLLMGGYGYLGVCIDSAAAVQQAFCGRCTLYPLVLGGDAKSGLVALYKDAQKGAWEYAAEAAALQEALVQLPCDAVQQPREAAGAARRALACLPDVSVFAAVGRCRRGLQAALGTALGLCPGT